MRKIKTYTPISTAGEGPTCSSVEEAIFDIILDVLRDNADIKGYSYQKIASISETLTDSWEATKWEEGIHKVLDKHEIRVKTISEEEYMLLRKNNEN